MDTRIDTRFPAEILHASDQASFEEFCNQHQNNTFERLNIIGSPRKGYEITDFTPLGRLQSLKALILSSPITQKQLEQICRLTQLEELRIDHAGKLTSVEPIGKLTRLKGLSVTLPMESSRYHALPNIEPLASLADLEWLDLACVRIEQGGLAPLRRLHKLKQVETISEYWNEREHLKESNPNLVIKI